MFKNLSDLIQSKEERSNKFKVAIRSVLATTAIFTTITLIALNPTYANKTNFETVYHVYMNDTYIGAASSQDLIEETIEAKIKEVEEEYGQLNYVLGNDVNYIPETVFKSRAKDQKVKESLKENLTIEVAAAGIYINDEEEIYLETAEEAEEAEEVIEEIKLQHVSKKDLKTIENKDDNSKEEPLKAGDSRIVSVDLTKDLAIKDSEAKPKEILSVKEAVKLLQKGTLEEKVYKVKSGDVLGKIANDHDLKVKELLKLNPKLKEDTVLQIDQKVNVTALEPIIDVVVTKEVNQEEKISFEKEVKEDDSMYKGDSKVSQKGKDGLREVTYLVTEKNGQETDKETVSENILKKPVKEITIKGTKVMPSRGTGSFTWPASGGYVSSSYGYRWGKLHKGVDIARPSSRTIKAADNGVVVSAGWNGGYGNQIVIDHKNGFRSSYSHLSSINVNVGQTVPSGSAIGVMGSTGNSTGVHLHFELYKNGSLVNPISYIR